METLKIINITPQNAEEQTLFCIQDIKNPGFESKRKWFEKRYDEGLRLKILKNEVGKMIGFIEYIAATKAWRPVDANNFMFIHCMYVYAKKDRHKGYGAMLINEAEKEAKNAPSGFAVFNLLHDGKLLEDHYLSATRFRNILKKELQN